MPILLHLVSGLLFGAGLIVSGMADPAKVLGFLDVSGNWDPSLLLVMVAAVAVTAIGYRLAWRRKRPWLAPSFDLPTNRQIDTRLLAGAAIFGIGWGLAGICPGPGLVLFGMSPTAPAILAFVLAMLIGLGAAARLRAKS